MDPSIANSCPSTSVVCGVLLVDQDQELLAFRAMLLVRSNYRVTTACSERSIPDLASDLGSDLGVDLGAVARIDVAILSDTLGLSGLRSAAIYVRAHWPEARILVLRVAPSPLEGYLYNEAVDHTIQPEELIDIVARLSADASTEVTDAPPTAPQFSVPSLRFRPSAQKTGPAEVTPPAQGKNPQKHRHGLTNRHSSRATELRHMR
jgi:hypothetical protein